MYFSKSKYTTFWDCPRMCWLQKYKPELQQIDAAAQSRMEIGGHVGELAKGLFGEYADAMVIKSDGALDLSAMIDRTKELLQSGAQNICEAAFSFNGLYCAVDILHKEDDGYAIYEVKSTTSVKDYHIADVAYQKYVLQKCGITVTGAHVVVLNNKYVRHGELDKKQLFSVDGGVDISDRIAAEYKDVESTLQRAEVIMSSTDEPDIDLHNGCNTCGFWKHCAEHLPKPSVLDLYRFGGKWECYQNGIVSFSDVISKGIPLSEMQARQVDFALNDRGTHVDKKAIVEFLQTLSYPLYFLDFETMQLAVPDYDGTRPFEQIPFQYSVHYAESEDGAVIHKEFLAESGTDPRRALAEKLCADIPEGVCTLAYNASTEKGIVGKLAEQFPDLSEHLLDIQSGIKDLLPVFNKGHYYKREMGGSFSIKSVLPAICPDKDYHDLDGVQNGMDAMDIFPKIKDMPPDQAKEARERLLKYCALDTEAMVVLWRELVRVCR